MKSILFCSDLSNDSNAALNYTIEIAKAFSAKVEVFHSFHIPIPDAMQDISSNAAREAIHYSEDEIRKELNLICEKIQDKTSLDIQPVVCDCLVEWNGSDYKKIEEEGGLVHSDLIVLGSRNAMGIVKLIGTTATKLVSKLNYPVLVVPEALSWTGFKNIVFATDLKVESFTSSDLIDFAKNFNSAITFVHIDNPGDTGADKKRFAAFKKSLTESTDYLTVKFDSITFKDPANGLNEYMYHNKADLLCLQRHQYTLLESIIHKSITKEIIFRSDLPVLILD